MKKKHIGKAIVVVGVLCIVVFLVQRNLEHERKFGNNPKYKEYVCRDYHLVYRGDGERNGTYEINIGDVPYVFRYILINDVSDDKLIAAEMRTNVFFEDRYEGVLQSPNYEIDILKEWKAEEILLYYIESGDEREVMIESGFTDNLIKEIRELSLNQEPIGGNYYGPIHFQEYKESYLSIRPDTYIRIRFEESEEIMWETRVHIVQSAYNKSQYMVMLECGVRNKDYEKTFENVILDPSSELYKFILGAYLEGELKE